MDKMEEKNNTVTEICKGSIKGGFGVSKVPYIALITLIFMIFHLSVCLSPLVYIIFTSKGTMFLTLPQMSSIVAITK